MSDLISRSEVNDVIDELEIYTCGRPNTMNVEISVLQLQRLINKLKNIPTAYSADRVVEELEQHYDDDSVICGLAYNDAIKKAIENGKQDGVSDVCEWTQSEDMAISPHTFSKHKIKQWDGLYTLNICPHCEKKIKVVE